MRRDGRDTSAIATASACLGRDAERDRLRRAVAAAGKGTPTAVVLRGEAGIGKSTLLAAALADVDDSVIVLAASGDEAEAGLDFGVVEQLLRAAPLDADRRSRITPRPGTDPLSAGASLLRAFDELGAERADHTVVLAIDDAHLADSASLQALTFAFRRVRTDAVALVVAGRPIDPSPLPPGLERLAHRTGGVLELGGLDIDATGDLAASVHGPLSAVAVRRLRAHTGGHPLHTSVLLAQLTRDQLLRPEELPAPRSFSSLVVGRLASCTPAARRLAEALAVWPGTVRLADAGTVAKVAGPPTAADELIDAELCQAFGPVTSPSIEFRHSLIRASVRGDLAPWRLADLHRRAAAVVGGDDGLRHRLAGATAPDDDLAAAAVDLAEREVARGARRLAARLLQQAAAITADEALRERRVLLALDHLMTVGDPVGPELEAVGAFADTALRSYVLGRARMNSGCFDTARPLLERAWDQLVGAPDPHVGATIAEQLALIAIWTLRAEEVTRWAQRSAEAGGAALSATLVCHGLALAGDLAAAARAADAAIDVASAPLVAADAHLARGIVALWAGDLGRAQVELSLVVRDGGAGGDAAGRQRAGLPRRSPRARRRAGSGHRAGAGGGHAGGRRPGGVAGATPVRVPGGGAGLRRPARRGSPSRRDRDDGRSGHQSRACRPVGRVGLAAHRRRLVRSRHRRRGG
jgi:hypothetical protein